MKRITTLTLFLVFACGNLATQIQEKTTKFNEYSVRTGTNRQGAFIQLIKKGIIIFERVGGEGSYNKVDTVDFNGDGLEDYVFSYKFEDYFNLAIILSEPSQKYILKSLGDYNYPDIYCEDFVNSDTSYLANFIIKDVQNDQTKEILINCLVKGNKLIKTCLTDTILLQSTSSYNLK